jgi:hypothetical protein
MADAAQALEGESDDALADIRLHLRFGWTALLCFLVMGAVLESLHGFKVGWYLDVSNTTRRHLWTLAHAHGTLIALLNVAFALTLRVIDMEPGRRRLASRSLIGAAVLMPGGFLLGGVDAYGGDPGLGVLLVPVGAVLLALGVLLTALQAGSPRTR